MNSHSNHHQPCYCAGEMHGPDSPASSPPGPGFQGYNAALRRTGYEALLDLARTVESKIVPGACTPSVTRKCNVSTACTSDSTTWLCVPSSHGGSEGCCRGRRGDRAFNRAQVSSTSCPHHVPFQTIEKGELELKVLMKVVNHHLDPQSTLSLNEHMPPPACRGIEGHPGRLTAE